MSLVEEKERIQREGDASLELKGIWTAVEKDPETGEVLDKEVSENVITEEGAQLIAQILNPVETMVDISWIAVGDGATVGNSESVTQSLLVNEQDRKQDTAPTTADAAAGHKVVWQQTFGPGLCVVTEFGLFNESQDDSGCLASYNIPSIKKDAQDAELTVTYELIVNEG